MHRFHSNIIFWWQRPEQVCQDSSLWCLLCHTTNIRQKHLIHAYKLKFIIHYYLLKYFIKMEARYGLQGQVKPDSLKHDLIKRSKEATKSEQGPPKAKSKSHVAGWVVVLAKLLVVVWLH